MILLEPGNRILAETVKAQIKPPSGKHEVLQDVEDQKQSRQPMDIKLCDFDDHIDPADTNTMKVSINLPCYNTIKDQGALAAAEKAFPGLIVPSDPGYDVTLSINLTQLPSAFTPDELITRISLIKNILIGGVFDQFFIALLAPAPSPIAPFTFALRSDTILYFIPKPDRVTVIFSIDFADQTDAAIARIFMQEFVEAKRRLGSAPPCTFSHNQPLELSAFKSDNNKATPQNLGYLSFAVLKNHLENNKKEKVIQVLQLFRNYLQYHIKCSKSYFHNRMRARVVALLKVLARAKQDRVGEEQNKKTITGRTFVRS